MQKALLLFVFTLGLGAHAGTAVSQIQISVTVLSACRILTGPQEQVRLQEREVSVTCNILDPITVFSERGLSLSASCENPSFTLILQAPFKDSRFFVCSDQPGLIEIHL